MRTIQQLRSTQKTVIVDEIKKGDYVFATKYSDASPTDRWRVDIVDRVEYLNGKTCVFFSETGVIPFRFAQKIDDSEGSLILNDWLETYP